MLLHDEQSRMYCVVAPGTGNHPAVGSGETCSHASGAKSPHHPDGGQRRFQSRNSPSRGDFPSHCSTLAGTLFGSAVSWIGKRCSSSRTHTNNSRTHHPGCGRCDSPYETRQRHTLEYAEYGRVPGVEPSGHSPDLETTPSQATPDQDFQAQPRHANSEPNRPPIPTQIGHLFRSKPATVTEQIGHPWGGVN